MIGAMISRYNDEVLDYIKKAGFKLQIINVEYNEDAVRQAEQYCGGLKFDENDEQPLIHNHQIDLNDNPEQALSQLSKQYTNGEGFDLIFSNYVLQHLKQAKRVLQACEHNLTPIGLTSHVVPDDRFKFLAFSNNGVPNERANAAAGKMVKLFIDTLHPNVDRFSGGNLYEQSGQTFECDYTQIGIDTPQTSEQVKKCLKRDFWYAAELFDAASAGAPGAKEAAEEAMRQLAIIEEEIAKGATYSLGEYRMTMGNNRHFRKTKEQKVGEGKEIKDVSLVKADLDRIKQQLALDKK